MNTKNENERKTEMKKILMILVITMLAALPVSGQIPRLINYQGVLTDDMGVVVADGSYNMTFRLYDVPSGGSHLWEEAIAVNVSKGIFNTTLGHDIPIDEDFDKPLYLALEINGGGELSPRRIFTANAYAFSARALYGVSNIFPADGDVGIGLMNPEAPLHLYTNISSNVEPTLLLDNTGDQSMIDFRFNGVTRARIRKVDGGDLFLGNVTGSGISFTLNNTSVHKMASDGSFGIDNLAPLEKLDVNGAIRLGTTAENNEGTIRWTGSDFEGYDGSLWNSLTTGGGSSLPSGTSGQTLRHNGADWVASSNLTNNGTDIGIGTTSPIHPLHIVEPDRRVGLMVESAAPDWASIYIHASNSGNPMIGYLRNGVTAARNYITSDYNWNLNLSNFPTCLRIQPDGWASFGNMAMAESMNLPGALMLGNTTGSNPGSIRYTGTDFEGYVGGMWNSLTASGLPAGTTGQTLRYDGGWIADNNFWNDGSEIGFGTTEPAENLHIYEDINAWMGIRIENPNAGSGSGEQITFIDENGSLAGIRLYDDLFAGAYAGAMAIYNNRPSGSLLFRTGGVDRMKILDTGYIETYGTGFTASQSRTNINGGIFRVNDETGSNLTVSLEPDGNGTGGFFWLTRNLDQTGFIVDGNYNNTEATRVRIIGPSRSADFNMSLTGDESVDLPTNAISAYETLNEPGVASATEGNTAVTILDPVTIINSRSITAPAAGYVLVIASGQGQVGHSNGTASLINFGVSDESGILPVNQDVAWQIPSGAGSGTYVAPVTVHGLFEVTAGASTFYFLAEKAATTGNSYAFDVQFTVLYIPTSYGTVTPTLAGGAGVPDTDAPVTSISASDISRERSASIAADNARIEAELAEMRAKIEVLQAELDNPNR